MFIENGTTQAGSKDIGMEILVGSGTQRRMRLVVTVNKRSCRFIGQFARTESRRIANRIAQAFADKPCMEARPELRSIFTTDNQILLASFDNINRIDAAVRRRRILTYLVFIGTVKYTQRPGRISQRIGTVQLRINIERRKVKRIRRLHLAVARAIVIALTEFRKELFA